MCGIIAAANYEKNIEPVNDFVINQFEDQKSRGMQGFGMVTIEDDGSYKVFRATEPVKAILDLYMNKAKFILFHHRMPTSSDNKMAQTHPILVDNATLKHAYLVVHNGVMYNEDEVKKSHEQLGFKYTTEYTNTNEWNKFNDSEAIAIDLALFIEGLKPIEARGSAACVALQINKATGKVEQLFFVRNNGAPLCLGKKADQLRLSSEGPGDEVKENILYHCNIKDWKLEKKQCIIPTHSSESRHTATQTEVGYHIQSSPARSWNESANRNIDTTADGVYDGEDDPLQDACDVFTEQLDELASEIVLEMSDIHTVPYVDVQNYVWRFRELLEGFHTEMLTTPTPEDNTIIKGELVNQPEELSL